MPPHDECRRYDDRVLALEDLLSGVPLPRSASHRTTYPSIHHPTCYQGTAKIIRYPRSLEERLRMNADRDKDSGGRAGRTRGEES